MGLCRSPTYWYWSMSTPRSKEGCTYQIFDQEEEWKFLEKGILEKICSARVCMTCQHFNYSTDNHWRTHLSYHVHRRLIPHGDHLVSCCHLWMLQREKGIGWCSEVVWDSEWINFCLRLLYRSLIGISVVTFIDYQRFCIIFWIISCIPVMYF